VVQRLLLRQASPASTNDPDPDDHPHEPGLQQTFETGPQPSTITKAGEAPTYDRLRHESRINSLGPLEN